jgi:two-component system, chemotaxis family, sensor kinase CheA
MAIDPEMMEILKVFFEESAEGLNAMESGLLALETATDREVVNTIFRAAHSIKGGAGSFGLMPISDFTHGVETLLDEMRTGKRPATPDAVQLLLQAVDVIRELIALAQADQPIESASALNVSAKLTALLGSTPAATRAEPATAASATAAVPMPARWRIDFKPHASLLQTCNDPLRMFRQLETFGAVVARVDATRLPALAEFDPTLCYLDWSLDLHGGAVQKELAEVFEWVNANSVVTYHPLGQVPQAPAAPEPTAPAPLSAIPRKASAPESAAAPAGRATADAGSIRVATEKVDALINLVGELVITQSLLARFADPFEVGELETLRRGLSHLTRNTRELQESVLKIRMLPISFSFNRFPRLVHELSRKLGKKVDLRLAGETTELDKTVLEKIGDPLVHLVRNSLDHGLETPQVRLEAGKSETGTLTLNAYHEGGSVIIEVKDDGRGLDAERILAKAIERGLVAHEAGLTPEQVHELIFLPGFSTAETVSDVSGRGVGMDVVRRNIADLGGHVQIFSNPGQGSLIRVRLPLTLAILEGQMLRVGRETYFISLVSIIETVQPKPNQIHTVASHSELFKHREEYLPIIRLHEMFKIVPDSQQIHKGLLIVVESDGRRAAVLVDELLAQQQVVIKSLETNFKQVPGLAGATIHGDGTVALILDVPGLISKFQKSAAARELAA